MKSLAKAERLLCLLQTLRRHRYPVLGKDLAEELGISLRTLYRDVAALVAQGAHIDGSPGVGYLLRPGFLLPPLMLTQEEVEALVLGARWVKQRGDPVLQEAATDLLAKMEAVLPSELRQEMASSGLLIGPAAEYTPMPDRDLALIRKAIRSESKLSMCYIDSGDEETRRIVWPFALGFFDHALILAAWCELRQDYRHFRIDRIRAFTVTAERYPRSRRAMLQEWQANRGIPAAGSRKSSPSRTADRI
jgi:predicted DNA-binding transcriptional regulator YafY